MLVIDTSTGAIAQQMDYDEFGNITNDSNPGFQPFGFAGGIYDQQTKLTRFGARDYDSIIGRWTAKDSVGLGDGPNIYAYVNSDPVNYFDLLGLSKTEGKHANKNKPMNVGDHNKNSSASEVKKAITQAQKSGNLKHAKKLKGLLKAIKRGGLQGLLLGVALESLLNLYPKDSEAEPLIIENTDAESCGANYR